MKIICHGESLNLNCLNQIIIFPLYLSLNFSVSGTYFWRELRFIVSCRIGIILFHKRTVKNDYYCNHHLHNWSSIFRIPKIQNSKLRNSKIEEVSSWFFIVGFSERKVPLFCLWFPSGLPQTMMYDVLQWSWSLAIPAWGSNQWKIWTSQKISIFNFVNFVFTTKLEINNTSGLVV